MAGKDESKVTPEMNTLAANKIVGLCILVGGIMLTVGSGLWWLLLRWPELAEPFHLLSLLVNALGGILLLIGLLCLNRVLDGAIVADTAACFGTVALVGGLSLAPCGQGLIGLGYGQWINIPDEVLEPVATILVVTVFLMSLGFAALAWGFSKGTYKRKWILRIVGGVSLLPSVILVVVLTTYPAWMAAALIWAIGISLIPQIIGYWIIGVETYTGTWKNQIKEL